MPWRSQIGSQLSSADQLYSFPPRGQSGVFKQNCWLSTPFHKYGNVCDEGFLAQTRRERRAYPARGSVRSEPRRRGQKEPSPGGLPRFSVLASLLLGHSPTSGDAPSSRLARTENRRNKRGRIYETGYLVQKQVPDRRRISNKTTLALTRPTEEGTAMRVSVSANPKLLLRESLPP